MLKEALLFFFFSFFFFMTASNIIIISSSSIYSRSTSKIKKKVRTTTIKTNWCSLLHRIKSPCTMTSKVTSEMHL